MSRTPRAGSSGVMLTKTEQLRRAKTAAVVQQLEKKREALVKHQGAPSGSGRPKKILTYEPKKVDFSKPTMTKSMLARVKHAEKFKQEYERKKEETTGDRRPRRTPAPIGGDVRCGREKMPKQTRAQRPVTPRPITPPPRPITPPPRPITPPARPITPPAPRRQLTAPKRGFGYGAGPSQLPGVKRTLKPPEQGPSIARKTTELARMMNADVVQAEPIGDGPISNIVIPPGTVSDNRTTIVSIPQAAVDTEVKLTSQVANRSIQVISDTLDEQDAVENATVQNRLTGLQQARRDFVIAVANVGGNAVSIDDPAQPVQPPKYPPVRFSPPAPARPVYRPGPLEPVYGRDHPDILAAREHIQKTLANIEARKAAQRMDEERPRPLELVAGREHPDILAAREHIQKTLANIEARKAAQRMDEEFERIGALEDSGDLRLDVPIEEDLYQDRDISWEEDEETGMAMPIPSRVKAYTEPVPKQQKAYEFEPFDPEELDRFFDLENFPPCPICGPPKGREHMNPDLWELDDPWAFEARMADGSNLIDFGSDLIDFGSDLIDFDT